MEWYEIVLLVLLIALAIYFLIFLILSIVIVYYITQPRIAPFDVVFQRAVNLKKFTPEEYETYYNQEEFYIKAKDGCNLKAVYMPKKVDVNFKDNKERVVVISHGWTSCRIQMLGYAKSYLKLGFHVFIYDQRNHLDSDKSITTMGYKEADDLQTVIDVVKQRLGNDIIIGTHGESMGAATVMIHAGRYHNVNFLVEDCGYNNLKELLTFLCKNSKKFPVFPTIPLCLIIFKIATGISVKDVNPSLEISKCEDIPMLFNHGEKDDFVPTYMLNNLYESKKGFKKLHIYEGSGHARSHVDHTDEYENDLKKFLIESNII